MNVDAVRCEALFASTVPTAVRAEHDLVRDTVRRTLWAFGANGCAARVAGSYRDDCEAATRRMSWVRELVVQAYSEPEH